MGNATFLLFALGLMTISFIVCSIIVLNYLSSSLQSDLYDGVSTGGNNYQWQDDVDTAYLKYDCQPFNTEDAVQTLRNTKNSVLIELASLEEKRNQIKYEIDQSNQQLVDIQSKIVSKDLQLFQLMESVKQAQISLSQLKVKRQAILIPHQPVLLSGLQFRFTSKPDYPHSPDGLQAIQLNNQHCTIETCFNVSRCPVNKLLTAFQYQGSPVSAMPWLNEIVTETSVYQNACVFIAVLYTDKVATLQRRNLQHWLPVGSNHLLVVNRTVEYGSPEPFHGAGSTWAMLADSRTDVRYFRPYFDVVLAPIVAKDHDLNVETGPMLLPARRKYLLSFRSKFNRDTNLINWQVFVHNQLQQLRRSPFELLFHFDFNCKTMMSGNYSAKFPLCLYDKSDLQLLHNSTFTLLICDSESAIIPTQFYYRVLVSIQNGAIPVILGCESRFMPLAETIDWKLLALFLPIGRISELHFILSSYEDNAIVQLRKQGHDVFYNYFASHKKQMTALLTLLGNRLSIPVKPMTDVTNRVIYDELHPPTRTVDVPFESETEEYLGPIEAPKPSISYARNFSDMHHSYRLWNQFFDVSSRYPENPLIQPDLMPSEAKFIGSHDGFRPILNGSGGSGVAFSESLGGNTPHEQFTVVMLTFEREQVLVNSIARLNRLPYLNKVIVVWNTRSEPQDNIVWPRLTVPLVVIKPEQNTLNNRFLPYKQIETDAVLSLDDDAHLRHDEIVFGFRTWREERSRIVGFPGRFHAWDVEHKSWLYNSNHSCELSMVLTGAAFFHKYYMYQYTYTMPAVIRNEVDKLMNCEDIAFNFLVTSRWTFRCPGCPETLSSDESHFNERHTCIQYFSQVYGYNPLLYTQFRLDSVLFKTRLPKRHRKCFKFV